MPPFFLLCDPSALESRAKRLGIGIPIAPVEPGEAAPIFSRALPVAPLRNRFTDACGAPDPANAAGVIEAIDRAVELVVNGQAGAVVTCPIAKKPLYDAGFTHPGHTEYLAELAERYTGTPCRPVMMLAGPLLKVVPVTIHIALSEVPAALKQADIEAIGRIVDDALKTRFSILRPRLAISGLNPHAGEGGAMGMEDEAIVRPAIATLQGEGIDAFGPLPADTMFHAAARATYDAAICMYHDQALIPAKALGFDDSVNVTLGLPFIRTSPDHGTAFSLAGTGLAKPDSLIAALRMAADMAAAEQARTAP